MAPGFHGGAHLTPEDGCGLFGVFGGVGTRNRLITGGLAGNIGAQVLAEQTGTGQPEQSGNGASRELDGPQDGRRRAGVGLPRRAIVFVREHVAEDEVGHMLEVFVAEPGEAGNVAGEVFGDDLAALVGEREVAAEVRPSAAFVVLFDHVALGALPVGEQEGKLAEIDARSETEILHCSLLGGIELRELAEFGGDGLVFKRKLNPELRGASVVLERAAGRQTPVGGGGETDLILALDAAYGETCGLKRAGEEVLAKGEQRVLARRRRVAEFVMELENDLLPRQLVRLFVADFGVKQRFAQVRV